MQSLFPEVNNGQPAQAPLVQFRAGKCTMSSVQPNGKFLVTADPRSGRVSLSKGNDGLVHFKWTNAASNTVEDDRIVFPGEYTFKKVKTGRDDTEGRVYQLRYSTGQQRLMFWMQEKSAENDEAMVKKLNDFLLNPNAVVVAAPAAAAAPGGDPVVSPEEWMRLIGLNPSAAGAAGAAPPARSSSGSAPLGPPLAPEGLGNLDLAQILRTLSQQNSATVAVAAGASVPPPAPAAAPATTGNTAGAAAASDDGSTPDQQGASNDANNNDNNDEDEDAGGGGNMEQ